MIKNNWYNKALEEKEYIQLEAGMLDNTLIALMVLSIFGFDWKAVDFISKKYNVPKETIVSKMNTNTPERREIRDILQRKDTDPKAQQIFEIAQQDAQEIKQEIQEQTQQPEEKTEKIQITDDVIRAVKALEGSKRTDVSSKGAVGVMQVMPRTWEYVNKKYYNGKYPFKKYKFNQPINEMFGEKYLEELAQWLSQHENKWNADPYFLLFVAYNAGPGNVMKHNFDEQTIKKHLPSAFDYASRGRNLI